MTKYLGCPSHTFFFQTLCNILMVWQNFFSKCTISVVLDLFITVKNTWSQQSLKNMPFPILKATGSKHPSSLDSQLLLDKLRENGPGFERDTWQDIVLISTYSGTERKTQCWGCFLHTVGMKRRQCWGYFLLFWRTWVEIPRPYITLQSPGTGDPGYLSASPGLSGAPTHGHISTHAHIKKKKTIKA